MTSTQELPHKLGANRKESAHKDRRVGSASESRDVHEDRGARQSKFGHPEHTVKAPRVRRSRTSLRPAEARDARLLPEHASGPAARPMRLRLFRDCARSVFVAGSFNGWEPQQLALNPADDGSWKIDLFLPPGDYEYRFIADGEWVDDPLACDVIANPFGSSNAILRVRA